MMMLVHKSEVHTRLGLLIQVIIYSVGHFLQTQVGGQTLLHLKKICLQTLKET